MPEATKTPRAKPEPKPVPTITAIAEQLHENFLRAAAKTANEADSMAVVQEVVKDLNASKRAVTLKMLGLDNRWGQWEVDHCNTRQSPITQYMDAECQEILAQWVRDAIKEVVTDKLKAECQKVLAKDIKERLTASNYEVRQKLQDYAESLTVELLEKSANEMRAELGLEPKALEIKRSRY